MKIKDLSIEKRKFVHSLIFPVFFVLIIWLVKIIEVFMEVSFAGYGIKPFDAGGLLGIITAPLIHGDFLHLFDNTFPLLALSVAIFYFYRPVAYKIFFLIYVISGFWVWLIARDAYHIGASGIIYGLSAFIFFSGVIKHDLRLLTIFLANIFLYGSMIWGIFPIEEKVSWESHLMGALSGMLLAVFFRKYGPEKITYAWEGEDEDEDDDEKSPLPDGQFSEAKSTHSKIEIKYFYPENIEKNEENKDDESDK